jgi:hypothetical protein
MADLCARLQVQGTAGNDVEAVSLIDSIAGEFEPVSAPLRELAGDPAVLLTTS